MHFSSRVDISAPNPIAAAEAAAKANGIALSKLNDSNPTRHGLAPELVPSVYTADPRGPRAAREALAAFLNTAKAVDASSPQSTSPAASEGGNERHAAFNNANTAIEGVDPDALYLLSSTSEAYSWLIKLLCDAGDAVLAPKPGYPLIESIARLECVDTVEYQLQFDGSWFIDIAELERLLSEPGGERIRALVLINPNNPTGSYVKPTERARIVTLCREHGIALIADEVFFDYSLEPFPGNARLAGERGVLTFALDGFSKMLAAPHNIFFFGFLTVLTQNGIGGIHIIIVAQFTARRIMYIVSSPRAIVVHRGQKRVVILPGIRRSYGLHKARLTALHFKRKECLCLKLQPLPKPSVMRSLPEFTCPWAHLPLRRACAGALRSSTLWLPP